MTNKSNGRDHLTRRGLRIVNRVARQRWRQYRQRIDLDELRSIGREALVWVLEHYDPDRGCFEGYARHRIGGAMADEARKRGRRRLRHRPTVAAGRCADSLARPVRLTRRANRDRSDVAVSPRSREEWGTVLHRGDVDELAMCTLPDPESCALRSSLAEGVRGVVRGLPRRQREVIERHYFAGQPLVAVAEDLGLSRYAVGRLHRKTLGEMGSRVRPLVEPDD